MPPDRVQSDVAVLGKVLGDYRREFVGFAVACLLAGPAVAVADPSVQSLKLDRTAQVGRQVNVQVRAVDARSAVNGMVVSFGRSEAPFGLSACRAAGSAGRAPGAPFAPGSRVRLTA